MVYWADQLGWVPLLALVVDEKVYFYEVQRRQVKGESCRIDEMTQRVDNLLRL